MPASNSAAYIDHWNQKFSGGEAKAVFHAAAEAAKVLTTMHQFEMGEQPRAQWFPRSEDWPALITAQAERDVKAGIHLHLLAEAVAAKSTDEPQARPAPLSFTESAAAYAATDNPISKTKIILQNPEFLNIALKQDSEAAYSLTDCSLADMCASFTPVLSMELDAKNKATLAPTGTETPTTRMRM